MALTSVRAIFELEKSCVLAPERYDPRRDALDSEFKGGKTVPLASLATTIRKVVNKRAEGLGRVLILDTCDAQEGIIVGRKDLVDAEQIGSAKKVVPPRSVIISRLRPYLRQVAFVDEGLWAQREGMSIISSTEFFVLESATQESIAFLVPFLLSQPVQQVLSVSQEGGHHPRFNEGTLLGLPVPESLLEGRVAISKRVEEAVALYRQSESIVAHAIADTERCLNGE